MSIFQAIVVAIVEGLTEFLPVSSTGHMILAQAMLGVHSTDFVKMFTVNIQLGAILSVVILYRRRFFQAHSATDFYLKLLVAFLPAAVLGFALGGYIDVLLESVTVVAVMLVLGGVLMLFADRWFNRPSEDQTVHWRRALKIGFCQCAAMIPGVSRSMATIVGGMGAKLTRKNAAEFSFFLAVPTMAAATGYSLLKLLKSEAGRTLFAENWHTLLVGNAVAFAVALLAIKFFISFLTKYGFKAFGWYRIAAGALILALLACGVDLAVA